MEFSTEPITGLGYYKGKDWLILSHDKQIIYRSKMKTKLTQELNHVLDNLKTGHLAQCGDWGFYAFDFEGSRYFMGINESPDRAEVALQIAVGLIKEQEAPSKLQLFEQIVQGSRQWQAGDWERLGLDTSKSYGFLACTAPVLESEAVRVIVREVCGHGLQATVDHHLFVVTELTDHHQMAETLHQLLLEELLIDVYMVYDFTWTHGVNLQTCTASLKRLLSVGRCLYASKRHYSARMLRFAHALDPQSTTVSMYPSQEKAILQISKDSELMTTVMHFFEHNLNVTETASALYVHRNTLLYRLAKIEQTTNYDLRRFEDAMNFYTLLTQLLLA